MTRGKHGTAVERRAAATVSQAQDQARAAEIRANRMERIVAERDAEIAWLKDAVEKARIESTLPGTYTAADVARIRDEAERKHRAAVRAGIAVLAEGDAQFLPFGRIADVVEAFECSVEDVLSTAELNRNSRRATPRIRAIDERHRQERAVRKGTAISPHRAVGAAGDQA